MTTKRISRRQFIRLGGAALGAAVIAGCGRRRATEVQTQPTAARGAATAPPAAKATATLAAAKPAPTIVVTSPTTTGAADLILTNGTVLTVDEAFSVAQAVAIRGGRIQAVGTNEAIKALAGPATRVLDMGGRAVTPGLIDTHVHFRLMGLDYAYYTPFLPPAVKDVPSLQQALAQAVKAKAPGEWLIAYYIALSDKTIPTKEDLDPASPDNPVFLMHIGGHWGTANSAALKVAGVTGGTKSPEGGIIEMGEDGKPSGVCYNHRAMDVVRRFAPEIGPALLRQSILDAQKKMAAAGITSFQDNNVRDLADIQLYQQMSMEGSLYLRNDLYLTLEWPSDLEKVDQVMSVDSDVTRFAGWKFLIDGQGPTAYCYEPHTGKDWRTTTWDKQMYKDAVKTLHNTGLQICTHAIGDAATDLVLDAYEEAMNANPRSDPRHRVEHAILASTGAPKRMKDLGVALSTQPGFVYLFGDGWQRLFGDKRMERIMITREWLNAGVHMAISSDAPSTLFYHPAATMAGAMNRLTLQDRIIGQSQSLSLKEALIAHTREAAYISHREKVKGSLEPGKYADIAVWPEDPRKLTGPKLMAATTMYMTIVGGRIVHQG